MNLRCNSLYYTYFVIVIITQVNFLESIVIKDNNTEREELNDLSDLINVTHSVSDYANNFLLVDVIRFLPLEDTSEQCYADLKLLKFAIENRYVWAIKALESSAMLPNNFIYGNNFWLGSRFECDSITNPREVKVTKSYYKEVNQHVMHIPNLVMSYKVIYATIYSPIQVNVRYFRNETLHLGLCLPESCRGEVLQNISKSYFSSNNTVIKRMYNITIENEGAKDLVVSQNFYRKLSLLLLGILLISTLLLVFLSEIFSNRLNKSQNSYTFVFQAFSLRKNLASIFTSTEVNFPEMNGIRYIASGLLLAFHVQFYSFYKQPSKWMGLTYSEEYRFQILLCGLVFVDAFFVMSGFLLMYSYLKNDDQTNRVSCNSFLQNLRFLCFKTLKRLFRIVPLYSVIILLTELSTTYLRDTSTILLYSKDDCNCGKYWWRNLLFIQNLFPQEEICVDWSWYLACEMQYFMICSLIYIIYCKRKIVGKLFFSFTVLSILGISIYLLIKNNFVPTVDITLTTVEDIYMSSFSRAPPYFVGVGMAYFVVKSKAIISELSAKILWAMTILVIGSILGVPVNRNVSVWFSVFSFVTGKWILAFSFCWLFISSSLGHKNLLTQFLSHPILSHFGKIAFAFYLLHPLLLIIVLGTSDFAAEVDPLVQLVFAVGLAGINYVLCVIFTIIFEMPYYKLFDHYTKRN